MKLPKFSNKVKVDKAESRKLVLLSAMVAVAIFCLVGSKQLLSQANYQRRVINAKQAAAKQLNTNVDNANDLVQRYEVFNSLNPNIIGGKNTSDPGALPPDGDNGRIVLDALPSKYDFPALITSIYKIMSLDGITKSTIDAREDPTISQPASDHPVPVTIPLSLSGTANYSALLAFITDLEKSIRPIDVTSLDVTGSNTNMTFTISMNTYYQPAKTTESANKGIK